MNWNTLNYVIEISKQGSFSKAAQNLYIAQPSLSQSIQALEKELGIKLFDRAVYPIKLTYAGELFVSWAKEAIRTKEDVFRKIDDVKEGAKTKLTVGVSFSRSAYLFPDILAQFRRLRPNCSVILVEKPTNLLSEHDDLDLLIDVPRDNSMLSTSILLTEERIFLAIPKCYPFLPKEFSGEHPVIDIADYADMPFIVLSEDQMLRKVCLSFCAKEGFTPNIVLECRSLQTAYAMAEAAVGVTLVPELFVRHAAGDKTYHCLMKNHFTTRKIAVSYRNDRYLTKDAEIFIELLKDKL